LKIPLNLSQEIKMKKNRRYKPMINLKLMRIKKGFTLKELAAKANLNYNTINSWELGEHSPSKEKLDVIAKVLECSVTDLI